MGCAQALKAMPLHGAGETLANTRAAGVHILTLDKVISSNFSTDIDQVFRADAELGDLGLGLYLGSGEMTALSTADILHLRQTGTELHGRIAVFLLRPLGKNLAFVQLEHGHRNMLACFGEEAGHSNFACNHA